MNRITKVREAYSWLLLLSRKNPIKLCLNLLRLSVAPLCNFYVDREGESAARKQISFLPSVFAVLHDLTVISVLSVPCLKVPFYKYITFYSKADWINVWQWHRKVYWILDHRQERVWRWRQRKLHCTISWRSLQNGMQRSQFSNDNSLLFCSVAYYKKNACNWVFHTIH